MTTLTATKCAVSGVLSNIASLVYKWFDGMALARSLQANEIVAEQLLKEYPEHTKYSLWNELNQDTIRNWEKRK